MTGIGRRYQETNVPIEVMRTAVEIAQQGSYTKAAETLQLGQPAVSAQIKRLQALVGGPIFERKVNGLQPTAKGALVIAQARRILESNDQILSLGGTIKDRRPIRLGLSSLYAAPFCELWQRQHGEFVEPVSVRCDEPASSRECWAMAISMSRACCIRRVRLRALNGARRSRGTRVRRQVARPAALPHRPPATPCNSAQFNMTAN